MASAPKLSSLFLIASAATPKSNEKKHSTKKPSLIKPTKSPKSILDQFKELPPDDADFVRQLDKQFQALGDNLKIKIVKENGTANKNSKRTIDGNLGYGYHSNQPTANYYFSKPKWQIYPYSQHDIPPLSNYQSQRYQSQSVAGHQQQYRYTMQQPSRQPHQNYVPQKVQVQIQPSQAYEIKETDSGYETYNQAYSQGSNHQPSESSNYGPPEAYQHESIQGPVIVLRIPGPAKYAAHLQALLQQYLEVRAVQYIKLLHDDEQRTRLAQHTAHNRHSHYVQSPNGNHASTEEPRYQSESPSYRSGASPQSQYANYHYETESQQSHNEESAEYQQYPEHHQSYDSDEQPQYIYVNAGEESTAHLASKENYPSPAHTQVYYPPGRHQSVAYNAQETSVEQPAHPAAGYHQVEQQSQSPLIYRHQHHSQQYEYVPASDSGDADYGQESSDNQNYIAITQKTPGTTPPYNYHAHPTTSVAAATATKNGKRQTAFSSVDQYKKFSMLANRLRENSAVMRHIGKVAEE